MINGLGRAQKCRSSVGDVYKEWLPEEMKQSANISTSLKQA